MDGGFVYIMSNKIRTTNYIGVTNDIERRVMEHKCAAGSKFAARYRLYYLMYFEHYENIIDAIHREKQLKNWHKKWKWNLIKTENPKLTDLAADWFTEKEINEYREMMKED